jgi:hypothetical protein
LGGDVQLGLSASVHFCPWRNGWLGRTDMPSTYAIWIKYYILHPDAVHPAERTIYEKANNADLIVCDTWYAYSAEVVCPKCNVSSETRYQDAIMFLILRIVAFVPDA